MSDNSTTNLPASAPRIDVTKARSALRYYRVMAYITGCWLLLLCLEMVLKYVVNVNGDNSPVIGTWVAIVHGWIYVVYLITVALAWSALDWGLGRLTIMVLAGVIPGASFIVESAVRRWANADLARLQADRPVPAGP